jgi:hypothetical protein
MALLFTLALLGDATAHKPSSATSDAAASTGCPPQSGVRPETAVPRSSTGEPPVPPAPPSSDPDTAPNSEQPDQDNSNSNDKDYHSKEPLIFADPTEGSFIDQYDKLLACTASLPDNLLRSIYLIDTGTQITLVCSMQNLTNVVELANPLAWGGATSEATQFATHRGDLTFNLCTIDGSAHPATIPGAYYSANARLNAISTSDLLTAEVSLHLDTERPGDATVRFNGTCNTRREAKVKWIEALPFLPTSNFQERTGRCHRM